MIEMRWVEREVTTETGWDAEVVRVLQYRTGEYRSPMDKLCEVVSWSDWTDVPVVEETP